MKKNSVLFICLLIFLNSCQDSSSIKEKIADLFKDEPAVNEDSQKPNIRRTYFEDGNIKTEITAVNNKKHGPSKKYYATGELHTLIHYEKGIKEGEAIWYFKNGKPYRVTQYVNGKMEGIRKIYYDDGNLQAEIPYKNDKVIQGLKEYNKHGKLITNYPEIIFETENKLLINNKYILKCKLSNNIKRVKFSNEVLVNGEQRFVDLETKNGVAQIEFHIPSLSEVDKNIIIHAEIKTTLGNPYKTTKTYNLKVDTR